MDTNIFKKMNIDADGAIVRLGNSEDFYLTFLGKFINDPTFGKLTEAMNNKNYEDAKLHSHSLKGVAANLGLTGIFDITKDMKEAFINKDVVKINELFNALTQEYKKTIDFLKNYLKK